MPSFVLDLDEVERVHFERCVPIHPGYYRSYLRGTIGVTSGVLSELPPGYYRSYLRGTIGVTSGVLSELPPGYYRNYTNVKRDREKGEGRVIVIV